MRNYRVIYSLIRTFFICCEFKFGKRFLPRKRRSQRCAIYLILAVPVAPAEVEALGITIPVADPGTPLNLARRLTIVSMSIGIRNH